MREMPTLVAVYILNADGMVMDSDFVENKGAQGSAITHIGGSLIIDGCDFTSNNAVNVVQRGTVFLIIADGQTANIFNTNFTSNEAGNDGGGAIFATSSASANPTSLDVDNCMFIDNIARPGQGGAMNLRSTGSTFNVMISNCKFAGNDAPIGTGEFHD